MNVVKRPDMNDKHTLHFHFLIFVLKLFNDGKFPESKKFYISLFLNHYFERFINIIEKYLPLSSYFFHFSNTLSKECCVWCDL